MQGWKMISSFLILVCLQLFVPILWQKKKEEKCKHPMPRFNVLRQWGNPGAPVPACQGYWGSYLDCREDIESLCPSQRHTRTLPLDNQSTRWMTFPPQGPGPQLYWLSQKDPSFCCWLGPLILDELLRHLNRRWRFITKAAPTFPSLRLLCAFFTDNSVNGRMESEHLWCSGCMTRPLRVGGP